MGSLLAGQGVARRLRAHRHGLRATLGHHFGLHLAACTGFIDASLQELKRPLRTGCRDKLPKKLYHLVKELFVFHWVSFVIKVWNFLSTCALVIGVTGLIPINSQGGLMFPLWACLAMIAFGAISEALLFAYRRAK
jgi:hypothetical protein